MSLTPPPSGPTFDWGPFKDWLFKLWKNVTGTTFGADDRTYSAAVMGSSAAGDGAYSYSGTISFFGNVSVLEAGTYTNIATNPPLSSLLGGASGVTEFAFEHPGGNFNLDAVAGAVNVPSTATVVQATGVSGYAINSSTTTNAVGGYFSARSNVTGGKVWSINTVVDDNTFASTILGFEMDVGCKNASTIVNGLAVTGVFGNLNPSSVGVQVGTFLPATNTGQWSRAYLTTDACTGVGILLGSKTLGANSDGQNLLFNTYDNTNTLRQVNAVAVHTTSGANFNIVLPSANNTLFTNGTVTCAQGGVTGQAVTLDQFQAPLSNKQTISAPAINTNYDITVTMTAPSKGTVGLTGVYNGTTATGTPTVSLLSNGTSLTSDATGQPTQVEVFASAVTKGTAYTFTFRVATGATAPGAFSEAILMTFTPTT